MAESTPRRIVLVVDDDATTREVLQTVFETRGFEVRHAADGAQALEALDAQTVSVMLLDYAMPEMDGIEVLTELQRRGNRTPVILMTGYCSSDVVIRAIQRGAFDSVAKPLQTSALMSIIHRALEHSASTPAVDEEPGSAGHGGAIIGRSPAMEAMFKEIGRIAAFPVHVLVLGETGTGKELVARALHEYSPRSDRPLVAVNCASIPHTLLESELFGHEKGAFTGAVQRHRGRLEQAHGGTLFLDEIGDIDPGVQAKLLRVLQEGRLQRLGGEGDVPVDVRFIAATHRDLERKVAEGGFREDLFYRLAGSVIRVPPLREREGDVRLLVEYLATRFCRQLHLKRNTVTDEAIETFERHRWPGNVRELENAVRHAILLSAGYPITADIARVAIAKLGLTTPRMAGLRDLAAEYADRSEASGTGELFEDFMRAAERELLQEVMQRVSGNKVRAAQLLGITRPTLYERLKRHGLMEARAGEVSAEEPGSAPK